MRIRTGGFLAFDIEKLQRFGEAIDPLKGKIYELGGLWTPSLGAGSASRVPIHEFINPGSLDPSELAGFKHFIRSNKLSYPMHFNPKTGKFVGGRALSDVLGEVSQMFPEASLVGHNIAAFDVPAVGAHGTHFKGRQIFDTLLNARKLYPNMPARTIMNYLTGSKSPSGYGYDLDNLARNLGIDLTKFGQAHTAARDAAVSMEVFERIASQHPGKIFAGGVTPGLFGAASDIHDSAGMNPIELRERQKAMSSEERMRRIEYLKAEQRYRAARERDLVRTRRMIEEAQARAQASQEYRSPFEGFSPRKRKPFVTIDEAFEKANHMKVRAGNRVLAEENIARAWQQDIDEKLTGLKYRSFRRIGIEKDYPNAFIDERTGRVMNYDDWRAAFGDPLEIHYERTAADYQMYSQLIKNRQPLHQGIDPRRYSRAFLRGEGNYGLGFTDEEIAMLRSGAKGEEGLRLRRELSRRTTDYELLGKLPGRYYAGRSDVGDSRLISFTHTGLTESDRFIGYSTGGMKIHITPEKLDAAAEYMYGRKYNIRKVGASGPAGKYIDPLTVGSIKVFRSAREGARVNKYLRNTNYVRKFFDVQIRELRNLDRVFSGQGARSVAETEWALGRYTKQYDIMQEAMRRTTSFVESEDPYIAQYLESISTYDEKIKGPARSSGMRAAGRRLKLKQALLKAKTIPEQVAIAASIASEGGLSLEQMYGYADAKRINKAFRQILNGIPKESVDEIARMKFAMSSMKERSLAWTVKSRLHRYIKARDVLIDRESNPRQLRKIANILFRKHAKTRFEDIKANRFIGHEVGGLFPEELEQEIIRFAGPRVVAGEKPAKGMSSFFVRTGDEWHRVVLEEIKHARNVVMRGSEDVMKLNTPTPVRAMQARAMEVYVSQVKKGQRDVLGVFLPGSNTMLGITHPKYTRVGKHYAMVFEQAEKSGTKYGMVLDPLESVFYSSEFQQIGPALKKELIEGSLDPSRRVVKGPKFGVLDQFAGDVPLSNLVWDPKLNDYVVRKGAPSRGAIDEEKYRRIAARLRSGSAVTSKQVNAIINRLKNGVLHKGDVDIIRSIMGKEAFTGVEHFGKAIEALGKLKATGQLLTEEEMFLFNKLTGASPSQFPEISRVGGVESEEAQGLLRRMWMGEPRVKDEFGTYFTTDDKTGQLVRLRKGIHGRVIDREKARRMMSRFEKFRTYLSYREADNAAFRSAQAHGAESAAKAAENTAKAASAAGLGGAKGGAASAAAGGGYNAFLLGAMVLSAGLISATAFSGRGRVMKPRDVERQLYGSTHSDDGVPQRANYARIVNEGQANGGYVSNMDVEMSDNDGGVDYRGIAEVMNAHLSGSTGSYSGRTSVEINDMTERVSEHELRRRYAGMLRD